MSATGRATILVVEDEPALRRAARRVLEERLGYRLVLAERAEEALGRIELGQRIDLVLSDLHLPGMDGLELYDELVRRGFTGRFLLTSGSESEDIAQERAIPPGVAFLSRPWTIDELAGAVAKALGEGAAGEPGVRAGRRSGMNSAWRATAAAISGIPSSWWAGGPSRRRANTWRGRWSIAGSAAAISGHRWLGIVREPRGAGEVAASRWNGRT
jgi:CheY-like chemotaxis protein